MKQSSKKEKNLHQPHDKINKRLLSKPEVAKEFLLDYLSPDILNLLDLNTLQLQKETFIDDQYRAFAADILYTAKYKNGSDFIYILIEHQSKMDRFMPLRIFIYMALIWSHFEKTAPKAKLPLIYPAILYNGAKPYRGHLSFQEMITPLESQEVFEVLFKKAFALIDLNHISDEKLKEQARIHSRSSTLLMSLKHVFDKQLPKLFEDTLLPLFKKLNALGAREDISDMLYYLTYTAPHLDYEEVSELIHRELPLSSGDKAMPTIAQQLTARGREEGIRYGIEKGREEGVRKGMELGMQEGIQKSLLTTIRKLFTKGFSAAKIAELLDLDEKMVLTFQNREKH